MGLLSGTRVGMAREFDSDKLMEPGWRQGAILDQQLALLAWDHAPKRLDADYQDHLVVTSHDCDILNPSLTRSRWWRCFPPPSLMPSPDSEATIPRDETPSRFGCRK